MSTKKYLILLVIIIVLIVISPVSSQIGRRSRGGGRIDIDPNTISQVIGEKSKEELEKRVEELEKKVRE